MLSTRAFRKLQLRDMRKHLDRQNRAAPAKLRIVHPDDWPIGLGDHPRRPFSVLRSSGFLVQLYAEAGDVVRLSVCRTRIKDDGSWDDAITWDELQRIKREAGFADRYAVEVYPEDASVVNVANMRHLWVLPEPPAYAWRRGGRVPPC